MGKLTCQDLMVGDWVSYCGFYNKVIYIGQKVSMYDGKGTEFTTDPEHIRPIPLTSDILVKNGFGKVNNQYFFGQVEIKELRNCWVVIINKENADIDINIHYVHQLQHLLRLAGIDKDIEL